MKYKVERNTRFDYTGQNYGELFPNLHKYPATMLPQIGIDVLKEFSIPNGILLDPYCGSGSSFASGLGYGLTQMVGYDINPLAVLISKVRFTNISVKNILKTMQSFRNTIFEFLKDHEYPKKLPTPMITNIDFWFSSEVATNLALLKHCIEQIDNEPIRNFYKLPFSETVRECSYTRNDEFKLYRMKPDECLRFNPDVIGMYFKKLENNLSLYQQFYSKKLKGVSVKVTAIPFPARGQNHKFDVVLTSPPYGDSRTTVAYGQFSTLSNEWLGINKARSLDNQLMGGVRANEDTVNGLMSDYIEQVRTIDPKRSLDVSAFYRDLGASIGSVATSVKKGGKSIYIVGNRTVKGVQLPTDQFIAEKFEENDFRHLITFERAISNKVMPLKNSPSNIAGKTSKTMLSEYIVVCEKMN
ncbi:MAG: hypothetical protein FWG02_07665 [Holophagaceae bacterium]|nr:hypothetical protein [Holophagaceae bacterium]